MNRSLLSLTILAIIVCLSVQPLFGQSITRDLTVVEGGTIVVKNLAGRVDIIASPDSPSVKLTATSVDSIAEADLKIDSGLGNVRVEIPPPVGSKRIDVSLVVPERVRLKITTEGGEIRVSGDVASVEAATDTGTITADVPKEDLHYSFVWTASRPRYLSDLELEKVKEKSRGKFVLKGHVGDKKQKKSDEDGEKSDDQASKETPEAQDSPTNGTTEKSDPPNGDSSSGTTSTDKPDEKKDEKKERSKTVQLDFTTARGIVLLNVPPGEVTNDLRERPLTNAAKAIVRSGDLVLTDAIRRASPKYFGEYARTLPPMRRTPELGSRAAQRDIPGETIKSAIVRVTDTYNRSLGDLKALDFTVAESGAVRDIISVRQHTGPVNLVLLLDVSGSVDNYVNFIRKAARAFIDTARDGDRISLILFSEDVQVLSDFSTNKTELSKSLDTFDAGGATAYYDAVGYSLADVVRPLRGERTAIVVLTDGDDNRSFLPFESLIGAIEESGVLIYPLYVPSALIAASETNNPDKSIDPLRARYMTLSARATGEGERLAKASGGVYYPITQLSQIQTAYDDIVTQIRTSYMVTFRSGFQPDPGNLPSPRLKIRVNKPNTFVQITSVYAK